MPMTKTSMKDKILTKLQACNVNLQAEDIAIIDACLEAFCEGIIEEITQNANITMAAADFAVLPGTFTAGGDAVTNLGENDAFDLQGKIN